VPTPIFATASATDSTYPLSPRSSELPAKQLHTKRASVEWIRLVVGINAARMAIYSEMEDYAAALEGLQAGEIGPAGTTFVGNEGGIAP